MDSSPSSIAARTRPWPARILPRSSVRTGLVNPNTLMLPASCLTCFLEWVRALPGQGLKDVGARCSIWWGVSALAGKAEAEFRTEDAVSLVIAVMGQSS